MTKKCSDCVFAIIERYGYSNYTVEGAYVHCSKKLNPAAPFDRWYGEDKRDLHAMDCPSFWSDFWVGPAEIDVERDLIPSGKDGSEVSDWEPYATKYVSAQVIFDMI